jgi:hypothetical protein
MSLLMTQRRLPILLILLLAVSLSRAIPLQVAVNQRGTECLYEQLKENESVTMSVFILSGPVLRGTVTFDGPVAPSDLNSASELREHVDQFDHGHSREEGKHIMFSETVDFEHLNLGDPDDEDYEEDDAFTSEEKDGTPDGDHATSRRAAEQRKRALERRHNKDQRTHKQHDKVRKEGEAFQKTIKVEHAGWYRFCVRATYYQVTAELDLRKESEFGGLNQQGNVWTYEEKSMAEEDKLMEEDTASEEGIKDQDFEATKEKLKALRRLLADIQSKQQQERHRLIVHAATNEHSHSRMVLGSLFETVLFMVVTGVQVWTIRRWFKGAPQLGR